MKVYGKIYVGSRVCWTYKRSGKTHTKFGTVRGFMNKTGGTRIKVLFDGYRIVRCIHIKELKLIDLKVIKHETRPATKDELERIYSLEVKQSVDLDNSRTKEDQDEFYAFLRESTTASRHFMTLDNGHNITIFRTSAFYPDPNAVSMVSGIFQVCDDGNLIRIEDNSVKLHPCQNKKESDELYWYPWQLWEDVVTYRAYRNLGTYLSRLTPKQTNGMSKEIDALVKKHKGRTSKPIRKKANKNG